MPFCDYLPFEEDLALYLKNLEFLLPQDDLHQVSLLSYGPGSSGGGEYTRWGVQEMESSRDGEFARLGVQEMGSLGDEEYMVWGVQ